VLLYLTMLWSRPCLVCVMLPGRDHTWTCQLQNSGGSVLKGDLITILLPEDITWVGLLLKQAVDHTNQAQERVAEGDCWLEPRVGGIESQGLTRVMGHDQAWWKLLSQKPASHLTMWLLEIHVASYAEACKKGVDIAKSGITLDSGPLEILDLKVKSTLRRPRRSPTLPCANLPADGPEDADVSSIQMCQETLRDQAHTE
jgi:hypothetical protein